MKKRVDYNKMYYGFPVILVSYFDENGVPNITTLSSSFTLGDMQVICFGKQGYAAKQIMNRKEFVVNVPDRSLMKEIDKCGSTTGKKENKFELTGLEFTKSDVVNAPMIDSCPISIECKVIEVVNQAEFDDYITIFGKITGRVVDEKLLKEDGNLVYGNVDVVEYLGDDKQRVYRYLENGKFDASRSFL